MGSWTYDLLNDSSDELDALREAVEVLESFACEPMSTIFGVPAGKWINEALNFEYEARNAIAILEDRLEFEKGRGDGWRDAASSFYRETLELKQARRDTNSAASIDAKRRAAGFPVYAWTISDERDAHNRTKAALKDAEVKVAELHEIAQAERDSADRLWAKTAELNKALEQTRQLNTNQAVTIRDLQEKRDKLDAIKAALA